jgi:rhamnose utilization protein RhaD (predicted bifunctional aldolase and dehydrogenase)
MSTAVESIPRLLDLSRQLGREDRKLAILGEGNTSMRASAGTFFVKASGSNLATLSPLGVTECRSADLAELLNRRKLADAEVDEALLASRVDPAAKKPSVEAVFHAYLLSLPDVNFVGHTHPVAVNQLLCTRHARNFARRRAFPDEIVCCGAESVLVPYTDPGLKLAQAIRDAVVASIRPARPAAAGDPAGKPRADCARGDAGGGAGRHADGGEGRGNLCGRRRDRRPPPVSHGRPSGAHCRAPG